MRKESKCSILQGMLCISMNADSTFPLSSMFLVKAFILPRLVSAGVPYCFTVGLLLDFVLQRRYGMGKLFHQLSLHLLDSLELFPFAKAIIFFKVKPVVFFPFSLRWSHKTLFSTLKSQNEETIPTTESIKALERPWYSKKGMNYKNGDLSLEDWMGGNDRRKWQYFKSIWPVFQIIKGFQSVLHFHQEFLGSLHLCQQ